MKTLALALSLIALCGSSIVRYDNPKAPSSCYCKTGPNKYSMICGSDGQIYPGWCWFRCAQFKNQSLRAEDPQYCIMCLQNKWCRSQKRIRCACTMIYEPVCGSNGQTYGNECMLECDQHDHPDLTLVYYGEC